MPSAEKVSAEAVKVESTAPNGQKSVENAQKENAEKDQEKIVPAIQQVISIISNKVRNLEKRKNKLDGYIKEGESGKELTSEQEMAVSKYDEVMQQLTLSKEFCKQFQAISVTATKEAKREARKTFITRQQQETAKVREVLMIQDLLQRLRDDGVRRDFLSGRKGACKIEKADLEFIDKFTKQVTPVRPEFSNESPFLNSAKTSAEQWSFLIDGRSNRQFADSSLTYEKGKDLFNRIQTCGYWEKDVKVVEVIEESRAQNDTPSTEDLEIKEEKSGSVGEAMPVSAPTAAQVPTPTFNDNVNMQQQQQMQQMHHAPMARHPNQQQPQVPSNGPVNAKVVEGTYYNQMKYSQGNGMPVSNEFATAGNFSFLQESELDTPAAPGSQQKMPINVMQPINVKHSPVQPSIPTQVYKNAGFYAQSPIAAGQMFPPGLKVQQQQHNLQNAVPHIPVNYQPSPQQLNQQAAAISQVPTNMIPKQQQQQANGNQVGSGFIAQSQTPPVQQQQPSSRPYHPPTMAPTAQYQQQQQNQVPNVQNLQNVLESKPAAKPKVESTEVKTNGDGRRGHDKKEKRDNYQQEPQIDTWTNETAAQPSTTGTTRQGSGFNRNNRSSGPREGNARGDREGGQGAAREGNQRDGPREGGAKYNNYRNNQSRNFTAENGGSDSPREGQAAGTFFRNNERYNGGANGGQRFENRGGASGGNFKGRDSNYRAGSGRFAGTASAAQGSTNPVQRK